MKTETLLLVENRLSDCSTQIYIENIDCDEDVFYVPVGDYTHPIGYLKFK